MKGSLSIIILVAVFVAGGTAMYWSGSLSEEIPVREQDEISTVVEHSNDSLPLKSDRDVPPSVPAEYDIEDFDTHDLQESLVEQGIQLRQRVVTASPQPTPAGDESLNDDHGLAFLRAAYQQALVEDPGIAAQIKREIDGLESQSAVLNSDRQALLSENESGVTELESDPTQQEGSPEDETAQPPKDEDFEWCLNRGPLMPGAFRCPCPSDENYQANWRDFYNPDIIAAAGC